MPIRMQQKFLQQRWGILFDDNFAFKIQACTKTPIFMSISCIAINAAVLATLIRVERIHSTQVWALNFIDNFFCILIKNLRRRGRKQGFIETLNVLRYVLGFKKFVGRFNLSTPPLKIIVFL